MLYVWRFVGREGEGFWELCTKKAAVAARRRSSVKTVRRAMEVRAAGRERYRGESGVQERKRVIATVAAAVAPMSPDATATGYQMASRLNLVVSARNLLASAVATANS